MTKVIIPPAKRPIIVDCPLFIVVDLFCGAGGVTLGFEEAMYVDERGRLCKAVEVVACVNHDPLAIRSHNANHPDTVHFTEDVRTQDLAELIRIVAIMRARYPHAKLILWASLECTNFSNAKGGQARDADSRTLAEHLPRYIVALRPEYVKIENVKEFRAWGPLDDNGKPISRKNGADFIKWRATINALGYRDDWRMMNAADYGAYTSRDRLFGCFAMPGHPIIWPEATHRKKTIKADLLGQSLQPWKAVRDVLDLLDHGQSIFGRRKPLSVKTLERIYAGLVKYVAGGDTAWLLKYNSTSRDGVHVPPPISQPCPVVAAQSRLGMVGVTFLSKYFSGNPWSMNVAIDGPAHTVTTVDHAAVVHASAAPFMLQYNGGDPSANVFGVDRPMRTLTAGHGAKHNVVRPEFLAMYYGNVTLAGTDAPGPTVTTKDRCALVQPQWIENPAWGGHPTDAAVPCPVIVARQDKAPLAVVTPQWMDRQYGSGDMNHHSLDVPSGTQTANPHSALCTVMPTNFDNVPLLLDGPCPTITANRKWHYMLAFERGEIGWKLMVGRSAIEARIRYFMAVHGIADIKMRMLKVLELLRIQGFPEGYKLAGTQTDQKKFIGNSVVPHVVTAWAEAMGEAFTLQQTAA